MVVAPVCIVFLTVIAFLANHIYESGKAVLTTSITDKVIVNIKKDINVLKKEYTNRVLKMKHLESKIETKLLGLDAVNIRVEEIDNLVELLNTKEVLVLLRNIDVRGRAYYQENADELMNQMMALFRGKMTLAARLGEQCENGFIELMITQLDVENENDERLLLSCRAEEEL